jgi:hypothetical protein
MATIVFGASDDLVELEGDVSGEVGCYGNTETPQGVLLMFSDGTVLAIKYNGRTPGCWSINLLEEGVRFKRIDRCDDENARPYSDVAHFHDGLKWCYEARRDWSRVT